MVLRFASAGGLEKRNSNSLLLGRTLLKSAEERGKEGGDGGRVGEGLSQPCRCERQHTLFVPGPASASSGPSQALLSRVDAHPFRPPSPSISASAA